MPIQPSLGQLWPAGLAAAREDPTMRVLVVEDDAELAETVAVGLRRERLAVDVALDGAPGWSAP